MALPDGRAVRYYLFPAPCRSPLKRITAAIPNAKYDDSIKIIILVYGIFKKKLHLRIIKYLIMKNIVFLFLLGALGVQAQSMKFAAKIDNRNSDTITILGPKKFKQVIVGKDGKFSDTFTVTPGMHQLGDGTEVTMLYLDNGYDLNLTMDAKMFDESIVFTGKGSKENNFLAQKALIDERMEEGFMKLKSEAEITESVAKRNEQLSGMLADEELDPTFKALAGRVVLAEANQIMQMFQQTLAVNDMVGKPSPSFDYENHKGGTTKLEDLRGKYVYIDTWATWCGPCLREIPSMKEIEKKYHGKNITFVGVSIDAKKDHQKWKDMVTKKELGGVQVFADNDWNSQFIKDYGITGIPRFILLDPKGNVVDANAPRPSDPALQELLDKLL